VNNSNESAYEFGPFRLDPVKRKLMLEGTAVPLTSKRFDILLTLIRNSGRVVSKDELISEVWPDTVVEENNLTHNVSALRKVLGEKPGEHRFIVTVPGQGYQFVADLKLPAEQKTIILQRSRSRLVIEDDDEAASTSSAVDEFENRDASFRSASHSALRKGKTLRPRTSTVIVGVLATSCVLSLAIYLAVRIHRSTAGPFEKVKMSRLITEGNAMGAVISPDGKYLAYVIEDSQGQSLWIRHLPTSSNVCIVQPSRVQYWGTTFAPDGNHIYYCTFDSTKPHENLYRVPILGGPSTLLPVETNSSISFSPDGKEFTYVLPRSGGETHLMVADADGTGIRTIARSTQPDFFLTYPAGPAWSPDGRTIVCSLATSDINGLNCRLVGVRVADGEQTSITSNYWNYIGQSVWLNDGTGILFTATERPGTQNQIYLLSVATGQTRRVTNDLSDYRGVSLTSNSSSVVAVQRNVASRLLVTSGEHQRVSKEIASETGELAQLGFCDNGRIVFSSNASGEPALYSISPTGTERKQLPIANLSDLGFAITPDGRKVIYTSTRAGTINLWKLDSESGATAQLTSGAAENRPQCSPDGRWVIYESGIGNVTRTLWKIPVEGGEPHQLTDFHAIRPTVSPDGNWIAFFFIDRTRGNSPWRIGLISSEGGEMILSFDIPATVVSRFLNWTPDSKAVAYINDPGGTSNVWAQPIAGGSPKQITNFDSERILAFDWSADGHYFVYSHAAESSYVALATELRD